MKTFVIIVLLIALLLLFLIAYQKPSIPQKRNDNLPSEASDTNDIVGKSRFVRPVRSQSATTAATVLETENQIEKANIFAPENSKINAVIPPEELDKIFNEPMEIDVPLEMEMEMETDEPETDEEAEEFRQMTGKDAALASGFTYEEMADAIEAINNPSDEKAEVLYQIEKTDLFEQLVSGNEGKFLRIKTIIDRHTQNEQPDEPENNNEYGNFDIADYLS
jgi:hypothetical protein